MKERHSLGYRLGTGIIGAGLLAAGVLGIACGGSDKPAPSSGGNGAGAVSTNAALVSQTTVGDLQSHFNVLLAEHVGLACTATNAALGGNTQSFSAAVDSLDDNSVELAKAIGSAYGDAAQQAFLDGWRRHIGFFVDYTKAAAVKDQAGMAKARADLHQYAIDLATLLNAANGLPKDTVIALIDQHVATLIAAIDDQAGGNQEKAFDDQRISVAFMKKIADPIALATAKKFPDLFAASTP